MQYLFSPEDLLSTGKNLIRALDRYTRANRVELPADAPVEASPEEKPANTIQIEARGEDPPGLQLTSFYRQAMLKAALRAEVLRVFKGGVWNTDPATRETGDDKEKAGASSEKTGKSEKAGKTSATGNDPVQSAGLAAGETLVVFNSITGETVGVSFDAGGNVHLDYNATADAAAGSTASLAVGETITIESESGASISMTAGTGNDWTVDATRLSGVDVVVDGVSYGADHVNIVNSSNGDSTNFWLGCLIQEDELATDGDDVATIEVAGGTAVRINGADGNDRYRITAGDDAGWSVERSDGKSGWYFYTGEEVVNVVNTDTGKTTSFEIHGGHLVQMDEAVEDNENVTTYYFTPGTDFSFQPGGHNKPVEYRIRAGENGDWEIAGAGNGSKNFFAYVGEGDTVRVVENLEGGVEQTFYRLEDGELVEADGPPDDGEVTTYHLKKGDSLHIRAAESERPLETIIGRGVTPQKAETPSPEPYREIYTSLAVRINISIEFRASYTAAGAADPMQEIADPLDLPEIPILEADDVDWDIGDTVSFERSFLALLLYHFRKAMEEFYKGSFEGSDFEAAVKSICEELDIEMPEIEPRQSAAAG